MELLDSFSSQAADLRNRILPLFATELKLQGLMLYGSRSRGQHRPDSDWDLLALVEAGTENYYSEYHGHIESAEGLLPVEMRIYSEAELGRVIEQKDLRRISSVSDGLIVCDPAGVLARLQATARLALDKMLAELRSEIDQVVPAEIIQMLQTAISETRLNVLNLAAKGNALAAQAVFTELITDFIVYTEFLRMRLSKVSVSNEELTALYFLRRGRGGRFFNTQRYILNGRLRRLIRDIDCVLENGPPSQVLVIEKIFEIIESAFLDLTGKKLILPFSDWPQTIIQRSVELK